MARSPLARLDGLDDVLACPACRGALQVSPGALCCEACGRSYRPREGLFDLAPEIDRPSGLAQRWMESPAVARIYERAFRPVFTRLGSRIRYADEERFLAATVAPAPGAAPLLDLACGTGRYLRRLARLQPDRALLGLDVSFAMLGIACADLADLAGRARLLRGSALSLPFGDGALAAINCFGALHLFPDPAVAIREVGRCLAPGGTFTCLTAGRAEGGRWARRQRLFTRLTGFRFFGDDELDGHLERAGLEGLGRERWQQVLLFAARKPR